MIKKSDCKVQKNAKLFMAGDDLWHNACLNSAGNPIALYIQGYKLAGDILARHVMDTHSEQDFLIYPMVFLYRQSIELRLKEIIKDGNKIAGNGKRFPKTHDLIGLFRECKEIIKEVCLDGVTADIKKVGNYIKQFSEHDPGSFAFRYPTDIQGKPSLPKLRKKLVNIRNMAEIVSKMSSILEAVNEEIYSILEYDEEMSEV